MTRDKLKQYGYLKKEIDSLKKQIAEINTYSGISYDRVGTKGEGNVSNPVVAAVEKTEKIRAILDDRLDKAQELLLDIETWLQSVDDSYIRQAITKHYIQGHSWQSVSYDLTKNTVDGAVISNMVMRFLKKSEENID